MEELMPLFLEVQIKSDTEYELLCWLDEEERLSLFEGLKSCQPIKPFQQMMLGLILKNMDVSGLTK